MEYIEDKNYIEGKTEKELVAQVINASSDLKAQFAQAELIRRLIVSIKSLDKTTSFYSKVIILLTILLGVLAVIQIRLALQQTNYTEVQSRSERILQAKAIQDAVKFCEQSPESRESGLYNLSSGNPASCSEVLEKYKD